CCIAHGGSSAAPTGSNLIDGRVHDLTPLEATPVAPRTMPEG
ncbi:hypothetical protein TNCT_245971, partial [Trichonephila clavata]